MIFPAFLRRLFLPEFALNWSQRDFGNGITFDFFNTIDAERKSREKNELLVGGSVLQQVTVRRDEQFP